MGRVVLIQVLISVLYNSHYINIFISVYLICRPNQKRKEMQTFFDMAHEIDNRSAEKHRQEASGLTFNASYYRASKEVRCGRS